ncbi:MAG: peptidoglycan DD-metalloendopeptidase family protein [Alistipes sp.]|jgi:murein DD-endopeptidase MepM/ murein hydrolase activator NlpD|nr:peptidoglycan DD-metalloendopeptidase family protein [Alistipes sp.]
MKIQTVLTAIAIFALTWGASASASAQRNTLEIKDIPRLPIDTIATDRVDVRVVTFTDGTFRRIPADPADFRSTGVYDARWDTINLFAYRDVELSDLPSVIMLEVADSLGVKFRSPTVGRVLSKYGPRGRRGHNGIDIDVDHGQPIYSAFDGVVRVSRWNSGGFGNLVIIRHPSGLETYYAHLSRRAVVAGEWVAAGSVIGYGGKTGRASGLHLHFEVRYCDQTFDPSHLIDFATGRLKYYSFALQKDFFNIRSRAVEGIEAEVDSLPATNAAADPAATRLPAAADSLAAAARQKKAEEAVYHTIKSGDTLYGLALRNGTTTAAICRLNDITPTTTLRIGRRLRIR